MSNQKISFDLELSNIIFKANINSLISVSLLSIIEQEKEYQTFLNKLIGENANDNWFIQSSHYNNIDWILLNSILLSAFSFFEHHLFELCRIIEDSSSNRIQIKEIDGRGIYKFSKYLFLVGQIQKADSGNKEWQKIKYFNKVRNIIAHNGGIMILDQSKKLVDHECYKFLKNNKVNMVGSIGHIRINDICFIELFRDLTAEISDNLKNEIAIKFFENV